jgi:hypothetical protein
MAKTKPITKEPSGAPAPTSITLTCPYGVYGDDGVLKSWPAGVEITDKADIEYLIGAEVEHIEVSPE